MKLLLCVLALYLTLYVNAYSLYGGYERMFFYYAYLIDRDLNGKPSKIAVQCKDCSFNEFVAYITNNPKTPKITDEVMPDVDKTANRLEELGLNREYAPDMIHPGAQNKIPNLFIEIAAFINGNLPRIKNSPSSHKKLASLRVAIQRVQFLRSQASFGAAIKTLRNDHPGIEIHTTTKTLYHGGPQFEFFDKAATAHANPGIDVIKEFDAVVDGSHRANMQAAMQSRGLVQGCWR